MSDILNRYRQASPELADLSDDDLIKAIHAASGVGGNPHKYARDYLGVKDKGNFVKDTAADLAKGMLGVSQIGVGAIDLATGGALTRANSEVTPMNPHGGGLEGVKRRIGDSMYSTKRKEANYNVEAARGFWNTLGTVMSEPRALVGMGVEAAPSMAIPFGVGGMAAKGAVKGAQAAGPQLPSALARAAERGNNLGQTLGWTGVTAAQTAARVAEDDPSNVSGMYGASLGAGALVGALTHGASILPGGNIAKQAISTPRRILESTANQAGQLSGQGVIQTGAENLGMGRPFGEGMAEAVAIGLANAPAFGMLGARRRPSYEGAPVQQPEGSQAPFTTEEIQHAWAERKRANAISNRDVLYGTPQGEVLAEPQLSAYEQFGRAMQENPAQRPVDTSAAQLAAAQPPEKPGKQQEPGPSQDDVAAVFSKYGEPQRTPRTYADGKVVMGPDGKPSMTTHFDGSHLVKKEGVAPIPYDSPERLKKTIEKLAKEEAAKPPHQRAVEQVYSDAVFTAMDRRPTSAEVRRVSNMLDLKDLDSVEAVNVRVESELAKLEAAKKPDPFIKDTLTEFKKYLDKELEKSKPAAKQEAPAAPLPVEAPKIEVPKVEPVKPDATLAAAKPEQPLDVMALLNRLAQQATPSGTEAVKLTDANGKVRTMTRAQYIKSIAEFKGKDLSRLQKLLGMDEERNMVRPPMTFAEIAASEKVDPSAVAKWAKKWGLTEDVVDRVVRDDVAPVDKAQESEFVSNMAEGEEASGFSIRGDGELKKGGLHGDEYTARDARQDKLADTLMAHQGSLPNTINVGTKKHHAPAQARQDAAHEVLKEHTKQAEKVTEETRLKAQQENFARMAHEAETTEFKESAERMYFALRERGMQGYDDLTPEQKVRWLSMVDGHMRAKRMGDAGIPEKDFSQLIKEYDEQNQRNRGDSAGQDAEGRSGDGEAVHAGRGEDSPEAAGAARSTPTVVVKKRRATAQQSTSGKNNGYDAKSLKKEILDFMGVEDLPAHMRIVNSTDITPGEARSVGMHEFTQAWVDADGNMVLLADRIQGGTGRAVFLHEVGSHLGIDQIFDTADRRGIVRQIERMAKSGSKLEQEIAKAAFERMNRFDGEKEQTIRDSEVIAYFVEEAVQRMHADGIDVRIKGQKGPLQLLLKKIVDTFKAAFRKLLGIDPREMTLDDIVDMAYGAAKLNLTEGHRIPFKGLSGNQSAYSTATRLSTKRTLEENIKRLPPRLQKPVRGVTATLRDVSSRAGMNMAFLPDLADWAAKHGMPAMKRVAEFTARKGAYRLELDQKLGAVVKKLQDLKPEDKTAAQKFLHESTMDQTWGYKPSWRDDVEVDADAEKKWKALSPEARAAADEILRHGDEMWQKKADAIRDMSLALKQEMLADAEAAGKPQEEIDALWEEIDALTKQVPAKLSGPYVPLKRFGNFVVTMKSSELMEAQQNDMAKYREMLSDPKHYRVEFVDSTYSAVNRKAELEAQHPEMKVEYSAKEKHDYLGAGYETLERLANAVRTRMKEASDEDKKLAEATHRALHEAIVQSMGEYNARTSTLQRKYVAGMNPDEIGRAFATSGYADNRFLATVLHNKEINDAMSELRQQALAGGDRRIKQDFFNEMQMRRAAAMQPEPARWIGHAMRFTTLWKLVTSPAYYLQYITQPLTMFLPVVQGRHGYGASFSAMHDAVKDMISISKGLFDTDISKIKDAQERKMLEDLRSTGTIQIGHDQSFGRLETMPDGGVSKVWAQVTDTVNKIPLSVEMHNRVASALAAYRLERKKGTSHEKATDYARSVINQSYGDYTSYSAPRIMQGSGLRKLVLQYRQFQFIHMALLTRLLHNAFGGADAETKRAARLQLGYMAGHYSVLAGAVGVPAANILMAVIRGVFGDDEDKDSETFIKRHVGNKFVQDMILGGVPRAVFGQDLSGRLGAGDIASPARYVDFGSAMDDKSGYNNMLVGLMGPFASSMVPQILQGTGMIYNGDYYRGMENLMPKGVSDMMKAARFANEGVTNKHGTVTTPSEDLGIGDILGKAVGSNPTRITGPAHDAAIVSQIESEFRDDARNLKRKFVEARKDGEDVGEIVEKWKKLMERQRKAGVKPATLSELYKAPSQMKKREDAVLSGVPYNKRNRKLVESVTSEE